MTKPQDSLPNPTLKRSLVISGGGARGAWGVGVSKALSLFKNHYYTTVIGTSTGSLMGSFVLLRDFVNLEKAYTNLNQNSIFNVNPFTASGGINYLKFIWRIILGKTSLGETLPLKKLIQCYYTREIHQDIKENGTLKFGVAVTNFTNNYVCLKLAHQHSYDQMVDWMWASANEPVFMSPYVDQDEEMWYDGGVKEYLPIIYAIQDESEVIDVIIHATTDFIHDNWQPSGGIFGTLLRTIKMFESDTGQKNIKIAELQVALKNLKIKTDIELNFYYMFPSQMDETYNELMFNKNIMKKILKEGYNSVVDGSVIKQSFVIDKNGNIIVTSPNAVSK